MRADTLGRPLRFLITPGQTGDITAAPALPEGQEGRAVLADKACDSNALRAMIADMGAEIVIPSNRSRKVIIPHDPTIHRQRNHIERCFSASSTFAASPHVMLPSRPGPPLATLHPGRRPPPAASSR